MPPKKRASTRKTKAAVAAEAKAKTEAEEVANHEEKDPETAEDAPSTNTTNEGQDVAKAESTGTTTTVEASEEQPIESTRNAKPKRKSGGKRKASEIVETVEKEESQAIVQDSTEESASTTAPVEVVETATKGADQDQDQEMKEADEEKQEAPTKEASSSSGSASLTMAERLAKLKGLRQQMNASKAANRADLMAEHQRSKVNPREGLKKERAREEAEKLLGKQTMEEAGQDYERAQFWGYSAESVERWNEKEDAKRARMDNRFTDWEQVNHKKYLKQVDELKPNLSAYNAKKEASMSINEDGEMVVSSESGFYRDANSVAFLSDDKPNQLAVDRMAADVVKQMDARARFSKRKSNKDEGEVTYINDANQRFNQKISRFYDKHTKEIRDNFERGTAL
ncbi:hypothetical protein BGW38_004137 [Lunasporangiospora selenospora]|uniref:Pre-mRNA-splicing factor SYF2 n=1 Tax=Lunasporangiospora selenospora TaxID=979761 RepID=A0A9P6FQI8_9FUNG|nr:hypothetical protein BGW38_004137 [Lunasporangiospora selenospora]